MQKEAVWTRWMQRSSELYADFRCWVPRNSRRLASSKYNEILAEAGELGWEGSDVNINQWCFTGFSEMWRRRLLGGSWLTPRILGDRWPACGSHAVDTFPGSSHSANFVLLQTKIVKKLKFNICDSAFVLQFVLWSKCKFLSHCSLLNFHFGFWYDKIYGFTENKIKFWLRRKSKNGEV